ncbi:ABC transporter permease [Pacificibacter marinus]|uniref:Ribose transport system permease protein RbsC n=1 Tax=Pacificibacter marinus TaxID=658057 RepID=A0A1Y5TLN2_9RHOB|nr:ABC transporter permease [Pacificibacter marinus]SEL28342.1 monosaccharide ABC transporter membrane protein, CUT2 family [Pacificibacter marinus]SLN66965.1 Ribose transport system permease protein RbsC [Pacificibacter marinus]
MSTTITETRRKSVRQLVHGHGGIVALLAILLFNMAFTPNFLQLQTLFVNISQVATIAIVAMGMTLVIATGGIDLSVGAIMALAGALAPLIFLSEFGAANPALGVTLAIALPMLVAIACGLFNGIMVAKLNVQPIIATLILFISGRGIAQVLTNGNLQTFTNPHFSYLGTGKVLGLPFQGWLAIGIAIFLYFIISRTTFGRYVLAIGGNERAAQLSGGPVALVKIGVYMICGALAGLAGLIVVAINSASDAARNGSLMELDAIAAAVVGGALLQGGRAPIFGAILGAVIIQLVKYTLLANGVQDEVALIAKAGIILVAVYVQQARKE